MAKVEITTNAIKNIIADPTKLKQFKLVEDKRNTEDYVKFLSTSILTLAKIKENAEKFAMFNKLSTESQADFGYLVELLSEFKAEGITFRILPIIELYESLLKENWKVVSYDREILNATESFNYTSESNIKICSAIVKFLREYVVNKNHVDNFGV